MALSFESRRSPVLTRNACVACSQPLAAEVGLQVLRRGGNAADAAVAMSAALNVTEPCSTSIAGDCFCLFYDASSKTVKGLNGSGRASQQLTLEYLQSEGFTTATPPPPRHALNITVPGAAAAWVDTVSTFGSGKLSLSELLAPAIGLAEDGYPVAPITANKWEDGLPELMAPSNTHGKDMLLNERAPKAGEVMRMPNLAKTFRALAENGKAGFYEGRIAEAIVKCVQSHGGVITLDDLRSHESTLCDPIKVCYRGVDVWEVPPSGQGITALMALNVLEGFDFSGMKHNSADYLHLLIEALQLSFADTLWYNADPTKVDVPIKEMLSKEYASTRRALIKTDRCLPEYEKGVPFSASDTVYFSVVDADGNACSFINSAYMGFGTALVPEECGFTLHNRGANFSLEPGHPNVVAPGKRPYHTIIPGMATHADTGELFANFGVMGKFMQPQGHVQVILNMLEFGMDPQQALDAPRFCIAAEEKATHVYTEDGITAEVMAKLRTMGHDIQGPVKGFKRSLFGRGQIIASRPVPMDSNTSCNVWWAGSDPRSDGLAIGY